MVAVPADLPGGPVLREVMARLLAPSASARYQSARAVRDALLAPAVGPTEARQRARMTWSSAALTLRVRLARAG